MKSIINIPTAKNVTKRKSKKNLDHELEQAKALQIQIDKRKLELMKKEILPRLLKKIYDSKL